VEKPRAVRTASPRAARPHYPAVLRLTLLPQQRTL